MLTVALKLPYDENSTRAVTRRIDSSPICSLAETQQVLTLTPLACNVDFFLDLHT